MRTFFYMNSVPFFYGHTVIGERLKSRWKSGKKISGELTKKVWKFLKFQWVKVKSAGNSRKIN